MKTTASPFLFLAVDLPPPPLFQDAVEKNIIPQVSIYSILAKFDGTTTQVSGVSALGPITYDQHPSGKRGDFETIQVPTTSAVHHSQHQKIHQEPIRRRKESNNRQFSTPWARLPGTYVLSIRLIDVQLPITRDVLDLDAPPNHPPTVYDLIANVTHESTAGTTRDKENTVYKVHLRAGGTDDDWYQIQDLIVEKTRKEMIFLGETVLQVGGDTLVRYLFAHDPVDLGTKERAFKGRNGC